MTFLAAYLEDFGSFDVRDKHVAHSEETLETEKLQSFDKGYRAGWDDALKAKADDGETLSDALSQNLQDLTFTYHEAHAQVLSNLAPLFDEVFQKILPSLARDTLGAHIADQLAQAAKDMGTVQIEVVVAPGAGNEVAQYVNAAASGLPISVKEAATVTDGQAELHLGGKELAIDLASLTDQIRQAVQGALQQDTASYAHG